jgi:hypothetical protein
VLSHVYRLFRLYVPHVPSRYNQAGVVSRQQELLSDRLAADVTGLEVAAEALVAIRLLGYLLEETFWPRIGERPPPSRQYSARGQPWNLFSLGLMSGGLHNASHPPDRIASVTRDAGTPPAGAAMHDAPARGSRPPQPAPARFTARVQTTGSRGRTRIAPASGIPARSALRTGQIWRSQDRPRPPSQMVSPPTTSPSRE